MLYAIGDLHLSRGSGKPMDIFGGKWAGHERKIAENWPAGPDDLTVINGDISWAMTAAELKPDMEFIRALPGRKAIVLGNHDLWFDSAAKFYAEYPEVALIIKGQCLAYGNWFLCGTKGWLCPGDPGYKPAEDLRAYNRESLRLANSLEAAAVQGAERIVVFLHFPPFYALEVGSAFLDVIRGYPVKKVVYGHLHGDAAKRGFTGTLDGVEYMLDSADFVGFKPILVLGEQL